MYKIAVVIPTCNRIKNMELCLTALVKQTKKPDELIISDDGGKDGMLELLRKFEKEFPVIKYYWHNKKGYRVSLARNQATRVVGKDITHVLYVDSDVVLNPAAIEVYHDLIVKNPEAVICGRYDWLPPMEITPDDVANRFDEVAGAKLPRIDVKKNELDHWSQVGVDPRAKVISKFFESEEIVESYGVLSGNFVTPMSAFQITGGFDENIEDRGQDGEFSRNLVSKGVKGCYVYT